MSQNKLSQDWRWYTIQVKSGCEKRCVQAVNQSLAMHSLQDLVDEIVVPTEKVEEIRRGKKIVVEKRFLSGYVLIHALINEKLWHVISKVKDVIKFVGSGNKPSPLSEQEVERIFSQMKEGTNTNSVITFNVGEYVQVVEGPFDSFSGVIVEINAAKKRLKVVMMIFGRETPVDLEFHQVSKEIIGK